MSVEQCTGLVATEWRGSFVRTGGREAPWARGVDSQPKVADVLVTPEPTQAPGRVDAVGETSNSTIVSPGSGEKAGYTFVK